jgi:uncharacterized glyoxalase superfamily protein PhnB
MSENGVPRGHHTVNVNLNLNEAEKAFEYYQRALGAEPIMRMPPAGPIMHAELRLGDSTFALSTAGMMPESRSTIQLYVADCDALFARAVEAGCKVIFPIGDMFWGDRFGVVQDMFGQTWGIATHKREPSPAELEAGMNEFLARTGKIQ